VDAALKAGGGGRRGRGEAGCDTGCAGGRFLFSFPAVTKLFRPTLAVLVLVAVAMAAPDAAFAAPRAEFSPEDEAIINQKWPDAIIMPSGVRYMVLTEGSGPKPRQRQRVKALYRGMFLDGREFSSMLDPANPFVFTLGTRQVIAGWEVTFMDMKVGEKRVIIIPHALGYGLLGRSPDIPNRATLVFEVELVGIE
jgi:FKBP-type peptidyl-prolyl cis-trans isomerase